MNKHFVIDDKEMGIIHQDAGPWRSYHLTCSGNSMPEMLQDVSITEVDQDGGDIATYGLEDACEEVRIRACHLIDEVFAKAFNSRVETARDERKLGS